MTNIELLNLYKNGDLTAIDKLIEKNNGLVRKIAYQYFCSSGSNIEFDDLQQEGLMGLLKAIEYFDIDKGFSFSTYAIYWIKQKISRYIYENKRSVRIPIHTLEEIKKAKKAYNDLTIHLNRTPSITEIAAALNQKPEKIDFLLHLDYDIASLDKFIDDGEGNTTLEDTIKDNSNGPEDSFLEKEFKESIDKWMNETLDERQLQVVKDYYGFNGDCCTLNAISKKLNVTPERVRQMNNKALRLLRQKSYKIKGNVDHIIDFKTNFYKKGNDPVGANIIYRENERLFQLKRTDHPFYKWYRDLLNEKYKIENKLNIYSAGDLDEINKALEVVNNCRFNLLLSGNTNCSSVLFNRLRGESEEYSMRLFNSKVDYYKAEKQAIAYIRDNLERNNVKYNF